MWLQSLKCFWGESSGNKKPFRKWCGHLGEIRSLLTSAPISALTASTTTASRKKIMHLLALNYGTERLSVSFMYVSSQCIKYLAAKMVNLDEWCKVSCKIKCCSFYSLSFFKNCSFFTVTNKRVTRRTCH